MGFEMDPTVGGVTLFWPLSNGFPAAGQVVAALRSLGPFEPPVPFPAPDANFVVPRFHTSEEVVEFFLTAIRDRDFERALFALSPHIGIAEPVELYPALLGHMLDQLSFWPQSWSRQYSSRYGNLFKRTAHVLERRVVRTNSCEFTVHLECENMHGIGWRIRHAELLLKSAGWRQFGVQSRGLYNFHSD